MMKTIAGMSISAGLPNTRRHFCSSIIDDHMNFEHEHINEIFLVLRYHWSSIHIEHVGSHLTTIF